MRRSKSRKGSLSQSPLADPQTLIHMLAVQMQDFLHFPNPDPLYVVLSAIAGNMVKGDPVWLMLVGPSSCGKTEILRMVSDLPRIYDISDLTGPASLLSGVGKKDIEKGATGGLLRQVGSRGILVLEDFTSSIMSMPQDRRNEILTAFRALFNGKWGRDIGTGGGRRLEWEGKIGMLAGGTSEIDRLHRQAAALGERWVFYRYESSDGKAQARSAIRRKNPQKQRQEIREWIVHFFETLEIRWPCEPKCPKKHEHLEEMDRRTPTDSESQRIISMATLVAAGRSSVSRAYRTHEVEFIDEPENPSRLSASLSQIYAGMEIIGLDATERWPLIQKLAFDSMPKSRAKAISLLWSKGTRLSPDQIGAQMGGLSKSTVKRLVEDLEILGVVHCNGRGKSKEVRLSKKSVEMADVGWKRRKK